MGATLTVCEGGLLVNFPMTRNVILCVVECAAVEKIFCGPDGIAAYKLTVGKKFHAWRPGSGQEPEADR